MGGTPPCGSHQVIFPGQSIGRTNDLYLFCCSNSHKVAPDGKFVVFVSSTVEGPTDGMSAEAVAQRELGAGLSQLKGIVRIFYDMHDMFVPKGSGVDDKVFI